MLLVPPDATVRSWQSTFSAILTISPFGPVATLLRQTLYAPIGTAFDVPTGPNGEIVNIAEDVLCQDLTVASGGTNSFLFGGVVGNLVVDEPEFTADQVDNNGSADDNGAGSDSDDTVAQSDVTGSTVDSLPETGTGVGTSADGFITSAAMVLLLAGVTALNVRRRSRAA